MNLTHFSNLSDFSSCTVYHPTVEELTASNATHPFPNYRLINHNETKSSRLYCNGKGEIVLATKPFGEVIGEVVLASAVQKLVSLFQSIPFRSAITQGTNHAFSLGSSLFSRLLTTMDRSFSFPVAEATHTPKVPKNVRDALEQLQEVAEEVIQKAIENQESQETEVAKNIRILLAFLQAEDDLIGLARTLAADGWEEDLIEKLTKIEWLKAKYDCHLEVLKAEKTIRSINSEKEENRQYRAELSAHLDSMDSAHLDSMDMELINYDTQKILMRVEWLLEFSPLIDQYQAVVNAATELENSAAISMENLQNVKMAFKKQAAILQEKIDRIEETRALQRLKDEL